MSSPAGPTLLCQTRYRVVKLLATGGLSVVFLARDEELNREVALKVLREPEGKRAWGKSRLWFEAEVTAGLEHPGVVPVYDRGEDIRGQPYFAMRFIQGENLSEAADRELRPCSKAVRRRKLRRLIDRFVDVCYTVDFANRRGIVHRDVTPRNVMLGRHGETLVVDWGLSKKIDAAGSCEPLPADWPSVARNISGTRMGSSVGTPRYMSPEQAQGRWDRVGPATDVFGLGATLYRLLASRAPFAAADWKDSEALASRVECPTPRELDRCVPAALEAICLKAMMPEPTSRYASGVELGDDLARWVAGEAPSIPRVATIQQWKRQRS